MGEGVGKKEKKGQEGRMTKGGRRDGEHEVGLDGTIGLQVTFELSLGEKATLGICGKKIQWRNLFFCQRMQQI